MRAILSGGLAVLAVGAFALLKPGPAPAQEIRETPGELQIIGKAGTVTGLCPLKRTEVGIEITGPVARVTVEQRFTNPSKTAIEAVYTFPLPNDAAVDDMEMRIGSRIVKGEVKKKEDARAIYETAKSQGKTAALLDQERPNIFTQSVANIPPGEQVAITIKYLQVLKYDEGSYELVYPMVVGPRFNSTQTTPEGDPRVPDANKITPPTQLPGVRAGHDIGLTVKIDAGVPIQKVESKLHEVSIQAPRQAEYVGHAKNVPAAQAVITLKKQNEIPNRDFILRYSVAGSELQQGLLAYAKPQTTLPAGVQGVSGTNGYFTLIIQPPSAPAQTQITPKEMVFVIDQTGSQQGAPIEKAKDTMRYCIQNLNPGDTFQLIGFNSDVYPCFERPVEATAETIKTAQDYLAPLAGAGSTDILKAATYALRMPDDPNRLRIICFMTDGYVGDDVRILDFIKQNRGRARMFPFGIGNSVNRFLIDGMAREGKGAADFVLLNGDSKEIAQKFYRRVASPLLKDITVDFGGLEVEDVYPKEIPDVFTAQPIVLKGRYTQAGTGLVTVRGLLRGQPWEKTIQVQLPQTTPGGEGLATLWAREKIEDLMSQEWEGPLRSQPIANIKEQITHTALEYHLMSPYTSFVAVEQRVVNVNGKPLRVDVPVEMPDGVTMGHGQQLEDLTVRFQSGGGRGAVARSMSLYAKPTTLKESEQLRQLATSAGVGGGGFGATIAGKPASAPAGTSSLSAADKRKAGVEILSDEARSKTDGLSLNIQSSQEQLLAQLRAAKLSTGLLSLFDDKGQVKKPAEKLTVQLWLANVPKDVRGKLKAAGFNLQAVLLADRLYLGTVTAKQLEALVKLDFVIRIEKPATR